jgi:hypothetical protein
MDDRTNAFACGAIWATLGLLAAVVPDFLAVPDSERSGLRAVVASVAWLLAACAASWRLGATVDIRPGSHPASFATLALASMLLWITPFVRGLNWDSVLTLVEAAGLAVQWREPVPVGWVFALPPAISFAIARIATSVRRRPIRGLPVLAFAATASIGLAAGGFLLLRQVSAQAGLERAEKLAALYLALALVTAAVGAGFATRASVDSRGPAWTTAALLVGWAIWSFCFDYIRPAPREIERVLHARGTPRGTILGTTTKGRPDLWAIFALPNASSTPKLALVRPTEPTFEGATEIPGVWPLGYTRLEPSPPVRDSASRAARRDRSPLVEASASFEPWFRSPWWPGLDVRTGIELPFTTQDWRLLFPGTSALASVYVASPNPLPWESHCGLPGTFKVVLAHAFRAPKVLVDDLPISPRIESVDHGIARLVAQGPLQARGALKMRPLHAVNGKRERLPIGGVSSREIIATTSCAPLRSVAVTTSCDLRRLTCEPWAEPDDSRALLPTEPAPRSRRGDTPRGGPKPSKVGTDLLPKDLRIPSPEADRFYFREDGTTVRISLTGRMPNWNLQLRGYDRSGALTAQSSLGRVRMCKFAGDLGGDLVAIAWRREYLHRFMQPSPGWTLESWNTRTGARRELADDVSVLPSSERDSSFVLLDRDNYLVVPYMSGVRRLTRLLAPESAN